MKQSNVPKIKELTIYIDGAARGNPGPAGVGVLFCDEKGEAIKEVSEYIGEVTNNQAEYISLIIALETIKELSLKWEKMRIFTDSELLASQIKGLWRIKNNNLKPLYVRAQQLLKNFSHLEISHVRREENVIADGLANRAIDQYFSGERQKKEIKGISTQGKLF